MKQPDKLLFVLDLNDSPTLGGNRTTDTRIFNPLDLMLCGNAFVL